VLDLSRILAGPWRRRCWPDFGADVIKIEHPRGGDDTRQWGPPYLADTTGQPTSESAYYLSAIAASGPSRSISASRKGRSWCAAWRPRADVLIENFKVGGLDRYGLGYDAIGELNPRLIYLSISAFGQDGPDAAKPGYDAMIQGMGGLMSLTGAPDGTPVADRRRSGVAVAT